MIKVNLLPRVARRAGGGDWRSMAGAAGAVLIVLGMGYQWWSLSSQARTLERKIVTMQAEIKKLEVVAKKVDKFKADKKLLEARIKVIRTLLASQSVPVHILQALNDKLPDEMWISALSKTGTRLVIRGYSFTDFGIANFMTQLGRTAPLFREVELVVSEQAEVQKVPLKKFEIVCNVAG
ncbi:MAG: PilN domain-containing protein [Candidatus Methylomirabilales bacterium]